MENRSDTDSSEILGDWDFPPPVNPEVVIMDSIDARSNSKELETRVSEKESVPTSFVSGEGKKEAGKRVLPPWMDPSYEWGGGKWKEDGRKKKKKESDEIPFKEIMEALLRNSGEKVEEKSGTQRSCVEILKAMGVKFP